MRPDQISQARDLLGQGADILAVAAAVGLEIGDVQTIATSVTLDADAVTHLPGVTRVYSFEFAHDTPGLVDGVDFFMPTVGDVLVAEWVDILEEWDGTTPTLGTTIFGQNPLLMSQAPTLAPPFIVPSVELGVPVGTFIDATPLQLVVSQDGTVGGADPGFTAGRATITLMVATPITQVLR